MAEIEGEGTENKVRIIVVPGYVWKRTIDNYCSLGMNFTLKKVGGMREVTMKRTGTIYRYYTSAGSRIMPGAHICYMVKRDLEKRIVAGEYVIKSDPKKVILSSGYSNLFQIYNDKGCFRSLDQYGGDLVAVDINYCYWNTAHNMGIISDRVYLAGMKKQSEWKQARNASIGSLNKRTMLQSYENGKLVEGSYSCSENPLAGARLDILRHVHRMSVEIATALDDSFAFFFTDCFFVVPDAVEDCQRMIKEFGYESKVNKEKILTAGVTSGGGFYINWRPYTRPSGKVEFSVNHFNKRNRVDNHVIIED